MTTLADLKTAILDESMRSDLTDKLAMFIERAEGMIARELRAMEMLEVVTLGESDRITGGRYALPTDWLEDRSVLVEGIPCRKTSFDAINTLATGGAPLLYSVFANSTDGAVIEFRGVPATDAEIELHYFARPAALVESTDTNRLLAAHPAIYQDAALFRLYKFTQDIDLAQGCYDAWANARDTLNDQAGRFLSGTNSKPRYNIGRYSVGGAY